MSIRQITSLIVVSVMVIVALSAGSVFFLFLDFNRAQAREESLRSAGRALTDASSVLGEVLFFATPRNKRQLRLAIGELSFQMEQLKSLGNTAPRVHLLLERQAAMTRNVNWLLQLEENMPNRAVVNEHTELAKTEVGGQSLLTFREMAGYLSEIDAEVRRQAAGKQKALLGSALAAIGVISIVMAMIMVWMRRRLLTPILTLRRAARRIAEGNYAVETGITRADEIGELAASFDLMKTAVAGHVRALADSEESLRATLDSIGDAVIATDIEGRVTRLNPVAAALTGWSGNDGLGRPVSEVFRIVNARTRAPAVNPVARVLETGGIVGLANHTALISRDGQEHQIADSGAPIMDRTGRVMGVVLVFRDVTESYRLQESLLASEERYKTIVSSMSDLIFVLDEEDRFADVHCRSADDLMLSPQEFLKKKIDEIMSPHVIELYQAAAADVRKTGKTRRYEYSLLIAGQERWFSASLDLHTDGKKIVVGTREITERKQAEEALKQARDELEKYAADLENSNRELEDFAYIASHDLKEPLRGIHNYSSFLLEDYGDRLNEEGQAKLHTLMRLTRRLESLLDDLLQYSRVSRMELAKKQTDPGALVREVLETMEPLLEEKQVAVTIAEDMPPVVCDRARVGEVFRNLITNAVKYNDNEIKQVDIGWRPGETADAVVFYVRDNGIGIPDKHQEKVFKIFKRLHGRDKYGGGTGSGLTLARRIIERHGGTIQVTSEYGRGSTFWFTLSQGGKNG